MILTIPAVGCDVVLENAPFDASASLEGTREYFFGEFECQASSIHRVRALKTGEEVASCILAATGGGTGIHEHSAVIRNDECLVAVGPFRCSLRLPDLQLIWSLQVDQITCFGVYHSERHRCYITHGEMAVSRVSYYGELRWDAGGKDILPANSSFLEITRMWRISTKKNILSIFRMENQNQECRKQLVFKVDED